MRPTLLLLLLLASCAGGDRDMSLSNRAPGLNVADVALANGDPGTALHIAQQKLAINPHDVSALIRAGQAQAALGQRDQAARSFDQALALSPDNGDALLQVGRHRLGSDPAAAARVLLRLTARDPKNVAALIDLGIARDLLGQQSEAQAAYRLALQINPDSIAANVNLGLSLALSGDSNKALEILRPLGGGTNASPRIRQNLAVALVLAGNNDEATRILQPDMSPPEARAAVSGYYSLRSGP